MMVLRAESGDGDRDGPLICPVHRLRRIIAASPSSRVDAPSAQVGVRMKEHLKYVGRRARREWYSVPWQSSPS